MAANEEEKVLFHQDNAPCHKSIATMAKLHELHFKLFLHPSWIFADLKRTPGKTFGSKGVISETEAYFEAKDLSFNK